MSQSKVRYRVPVALTIEDKITASLDEIKVRAGTMGVFLGIVLLGFNSFFGSQKPPSLGGHSGLWLTVMISVFAMGLSSLGLFLGTYSGARMISGRPISKFALSRVFVILYVVVAFGGLTAVVCYSYFTFSQGGDAGTSLKFLGFPLILGGVLGTISMAVGIAEIVNWIQELRAGNGVNLPSGGDRLEAELAETPPNPNWSKSI